MTKRTIENRLNFFRKSCSQHQIDTFLVLIEENRRYLSGFTGEDTQFDESAGALLITDTQLLLATDSRFETQGRMEAPLYEIYIYKAGPTPGLIKSLPYLLKRFETKKLGFESLRVSHNNYTKIAEQLTSDLPAVELAPTENIIENQRVFKEPDEIEIIRKALLIAENIFKDFSNTLKPGMTEKDAAWAIEKGMREGGADMLSFPVIVAAGENSALPHAIPSNRQVQRGEPILFDWGARFNGYCSDISRTLFLDTIDKNFQKVYQAVFDAQQMAIDAIKPGVSSKAIDAVARNHIDKMGFKDKFGHALGHGVGLSVHEAPRLSPLKDETLEPGMIITVEPGIYLPGKGGVRLENMIQVKEDGAEVLNRLDMPYVIK
ncbi:MAG: aminopeptidase P family protein [Desulfobacterales bacterium]|nr:aminopeptidase P family protein [Desulfobacterales bacterium]